MSDSSKVGTDQGRSADLEGPANGLVDFLGVYEEHFDSINRALIELAAVLPGLGQLFHPSYHHEIERRLRESHRLVRGAILNHDWEPLLDLRRAQGRFYVGRGIPLDELIKIFAAFKDLLMPHLVGSFAGNPERLVNAIRAVDQYVRLGLTAMVEAYDRRLSTLRACVEQAAPANVPFN